MLPVGPAPGEPRPKTVALPRWDPRWVPPPLHEKRYYGVAVMDIPGHHHVPNPFQDSPDRFEVDSIGAGAGSSNRPGRERYYPPQSDGPVGLVSIFQDLVPTKVGGKHPHGIDSK